MIGSGSLAAATPPAKVPVVAAGMEWRVDAACQLETPVEGKSMYDTLTLTNLSLSDRSKGFLLALDDSDLMEVPQQITLLANGSEPVAFPVSLPPYGPVGSLWFSDEEGAQTLYDRLEGGETVMLFTVFEMISLSPFGFAKAKDARRECLRGLLGKLDLDLDSYQLASEAGTPIEGDVRGLFTTDDYPMAALRKEEQGTVRAALLVDAKGKPSKCVMRESSGSNALDQTTCQVLMSRARFVPAKGVDGQPTATVYLVPPIRWEIPRR